MVHRCQSLIKGDKCGDPKCFRDERRVAEESILLTIISIEKYIQWDVGKAEEKVT